MKRRRDFFSQHFHEYICGLSGSSGAKIIECLGDGATDEKILDKTSIKMAEIRSVLNQLHKNGVVDYTREKNLSNGWFTYTWRFNSSRAIQNFLAAKKHEYENLMKELTAQDGAAFFKCSKEGCRKLEFYSALETQFRCPKCGLKLREYDNSGEVKEISNRIGVIQKLLEHQQQNSNRFNGG